MYARRTDNLEFIIMRFIDYVKLKQVIRVKILSIWIKFKWEYEKLQVFSCLNRGTCSKPDRGLCQLWFIYNKLWRKNFHLKSGANFCRVLLTFMNVDGDF